MPRELVHWMVLDSACERLTRSAAAVGRCLRSAPHAAYLGAVAHDAPYYLRFGASGFERVARFCTARRGKIHWILSAPF